ncbi:MAG: hypothetical protein GX629_12790, partial [Phycisphaerae bacterium]|nr:hypothetical protein [Phycisphaerae bacterium]
LWLRMSRYFPFCYIDQSLTFYNIHSGNLTQQPELQELFRRNNRRALQKELNWEQDPKFRRIIEDQIRQNWETELFHQLAQADKTQLQQTLNDARSQGWCSTKKSMRRIKILDHTGPSTALIINKLLKGLGR